MPARTAKGLDSSDQEPADEWTCHPGKQVRDEQSGLIHEYWNQQQARNEIQHEKHGKKRNEHPSTTNELIAVEHGCLMLPPCR